MKDKHILLKAVFIFIVLMSFINLRACKQSNTINQNDVMKDTNSDKVEILDEVNVGYLEDVSTYYLVSSIEDLNKLPFELNDINIELNNEFFEQNNLYLIYSPLSSSSGTLNLDNYDIKDNNLNAYISTSYPEIGTMDMSGSVIPIIANKNITQLNIYNK